MFIFTDSFHNFVIRVDLVQERSVDVKGLTELIKGFALALKIYLSAIALKALELDFNLINFVFFYLPTTPEIVLKDVKFAELKLLAFLVGALKCNRRVVICVEQ